MTESPPAVSPQRPWLGLLSYTLASQAYFYGRDPQIRELYERVRLNPLTVLYGRSGLGKTSLLQAGLVPRLTVEGHGAVLLRLDIAGDAPPLVDQARTALAARLGLATATATLWELAHHEAARDVVELLRPVLVFDQFEEIFALDRRPPHEDRRAELAAFMGELASLVENRPPDAVRARCDRDRTYASGIDTRESALRVVVALREDYLHELERWKKLLPSLMRNRMELLELDGPSALRAVVGPGSKHEPVLVDAGVGADIVRFVAGREPGTDLAGIEAVPPLLSLLCAELNELRIAAHETAITHQRVSTQSGDILQRFYERCFDGMDSAVREVIEDQLIDSTGRYRESSSRDTLIGKLTDKGVADADAALDTLIGTRVLSTDLRDGTQRIELTHDLLVPLAAASRAVTQRRREQADALRRADEQRRDRMNRLKGRAAIVLALLLVVAGVAAGIAYREGRRASAAQAQAQSARKKVEETLVEASRRALGRFAERVDATDGSRYAYLAESLSYRALDEARAAALLALQHASSAVDVVHLDLGSTELTEGTFSDDGSLLVTNTEPDRAALWDTATGRRLRHFDARARNAPVRLSRDGSRMAWIDTDGSVRFLDSPAWEGSGTLVSYGKPVIRVEFGADRHTLLTVAADEVRLWNLDARPATSSVVARAQRIASAQFDVEGGRVVVVTAAGDVSVHAAADGAVVPGPLATHRNVDSASLSPGGDYVVTTAGRQDVALWSVRSNTVIWRAETLRPLRSAGFSPDGTRLALEYLDGSIDLRAVDSTQPPDSATAGGFASPRAAPGAAATYASHPAFSPDAVLLASLVDATPSLRMASRGLPIATLPQSVDASAFRFLPTGTRLLAIGIDGRLTISQVRTRAPLCAISPGVQAAPDADPRVTASKPSFRLHAGEIRATAFSSDGKQAAAILESGDIVALRTSDDRVSFRTRPPEKPISLHYAPTGDVIVALGPRRLHVLDARTGALINGNLDHGGPIRALAFSPDGRRLALGYDDGVRLWSARSGVVLTGKFLDRRRAASLRFSSDGRRLVATLDDGWRADCPVRVDIAAVPERLVEAIERLGGKRVAQDGRLQATEPRDLFAGFPQRGPQSHLEQLLRWRYDDDAPETIAPFSDMTLHDYVGHEVEHVLHVAAADGDVQLARLYLSAPSDPRILHAMSRFERREATKALWMRVLRARHSAASPRDTTPAAAASAPAAHPPEAAQ